MKFLFRKQLIVSVQKVYKDSDVNNDIAIIDNPDGNDNSNNSIDL